jgi:hypothetical protein
MICRVYGLFADVIEKGIKNIGKETENGKEVYS